MKDKNDFDKGNLELASKIVGKMMEEKKKLDESTLESVGIEKVLKAVKKHGNLSDDSIAYGLHDDLEITCDEFMELFNYLEHVYGDSAKDFKNMFLEQGLYFEYDGYKFVWHLIIGQGSICSLIDFYEFHNDFSEDEKIILKKEGSDMNECGDDVVVGTGEGDEPIGDVDYAKLLKEAMIAGAQGADVLYNLFLETVGDDSSESEPSYDKEVVSDSDFDSGAAILQVLNMPHMERALTSSLEAVDPNLDKKLFYNKLKYKLVSLYIDKLTEEEIKYWYKINTDLEYIDFSNKMAELSPEIVKITVDLFTEA
jgi:hypothetical protein